MYAFGYTGCGSSGSCTPNSALLDMLLNPANIWAGSLYTKIIALIAVLGFASVIIGFFASSRSEMAIKAPVLLFLLSIGFDIVILFTQLKQVNALVATILVSPLAVVYLIAVVEWGFGHD
jgi:hypothetical protein